MSPDANDRGRWFVRGDLTSITGSTLYIGNTVFAKIASIIDLEENTVAVKARLFISKQRGDLDFDHAGNCGQPHSLSPNTMQSEKHKSSVTRIEVETFHFECELSFG